MLADVDKDGKPDLVYMTQQMGIGWAKPDPANRTGQWIGVSVGGRARMRRMASARETSMATAGSIC